MQACVSWCFLKEAKRQADFLSWIFSREITYFKFFRPRFVYAYHRMHLGTRVVERDRHLALIASFGFSLFKYCRCLRTFPQQEVDLLPDKLASLDALGSHRFCTLRIKRTPWDLV